MEMNALLKEIQNLQPSCSPPYNSPIYNRLCKKVPLGRITSAGHNRDAITLLTLIGRLLDEKRIPSKERRAVSAYAQALGDFVEAYERKAYPSGATKGVDVLKALMAANGLTQSDLKNEIGAQPVVNRILKGERKLTREHIDKLAKRFNVSPAVFFDCE